MLLRFAIAAVALLVSITLIPRVGFGAQGTPTTEAGLAPVVWQLTAIVLADGTEQVPDDPAKYTAQFLPDGTVLVVADCNTGSGAYEVDGTDLTIGEVATTRVACPEGSLSDEFVARLGEVASYAYEDDALVLALADDAGTLRFVPALTGVVWEWQSFQGGDGSEVVPDDPAKYTLEFLPDGKVAIVADCNQGMGSYVVEGDQLDIANIALTRVACPPESLSDRYVQDLDAVVSHVFRDGNLYLALPVDSGILAFAARPAEAAPATPTAG